MNLAQDLEYRAGSSPNAIAIIDERDRSLSYAQWHDYAARLATWLEANGVAPGDRVALFMHNSIEQVVAIFGTWMAGAVPVSVSALYNSRELADSLDKTGPVLLLTDSKRASTVKSSGVEVPEHVIKDVIGGEESTGVAYSLLAGVSPRTAKAPDRRSDEAVVLFTGGSTGEPKAVSLTHGGTYDSMATLAKASRPGLEGPAPTVPPDVSPNLILLPLFHGGGLQSLLFALHLGRKVVLMERFNVSRLDTMVMRHKVDNLFLMPTMIYDLVHAPPHIKLDPVRKVLVAGQALDHHLRVRFEGRYDAIVFSNYGSAEMGHVAGWTPHDVRLGSWKPGSVGRIYEGVTVEIRDAEGNSVPTGVEGEICVQTERTLGYIEDAGSATSEPLVVDGWVRSGDVGYVDEDGLLFLVGRRREMIKTGGFQVWPAEIESEIRHHPNVQDVVVVGVPDDRLGEVPLAFVVPRTPATTDSESFERDLINFSRNRLAHFKQLRSVAVVDRIPRSEAGKSQRAALREAALEQQDRNHP